MHKIERQNEIVCFLLLFIIAYYMVTRVEQRINLFELMTNLF